MSDLEQTIKNAEAGDWLDAMCAAAMDSKQVVFKPTKLWEDAGQALKWLGKWIITLDMEDGESSAVKVWFPPMSGSQESDIYIEGDTPQFAITRAVCLVGLRENPEKMEVAATALKEKTK